MSPPCLIYLFTIIVLIKQGALFFSSQSSSLEERYPSCRKTFQAKKALLFDNVHRLQQTWPTVEYSVNTSYYSGVLYNNATIQWYEQPLGINERINSQSHRMVARKVPLMQLLCPVAPQCRHQKQMGSTCPAFTMSWGYTCPCLPACAACESTGTSYVVQHRSSRDRTLRKDAPYPLYPRVQNLSLGTAVLNATCVRITVTLHLVIITRYQYNIIVVKQIQHPKREIYGKPLPLLVLFLLQDVHRITDYFIVILLIFFMFVFFLCFFCRTYTPMGGQTAAIHTINTYCY